MKDFDVKKLDIDHFTKMEKIKKREAGDKDKVTELMTYAVISTIVKNTAVELDENVDVEILYGFTFDIVERIISSEEFARRIKDGNNFEGKYILGYIKGLVTKYIEMIYEAQTEEEINEVQAKIQKFVKDQKSFSMESLYNVVRNIIKKDEERKEKDEERKEKILGDIKDDGDIDDFTNDDEDVDDIELESEIDDSDEENDDEDELEEVDEKDHEDKISESLDTTTEELKSVKLNSTVDGEPLPAEGRREIMIVEKASKDMILIFSTYEDFKSSSNDHISDTVSKLFFTNAEILDGKNISSILEPMIDAIVSFLGLISGRDIIESVVIKLDLVCELLSKHLGYLNGLDTGDLSDDQVEKFKEYKNKINKTIKLISKLRKENMIKVAESIVKLDERTEEEILESEDGPTVSEINKTVLKKVMESEDADEDCGELISKGKFKLIVLANLILMELFEEINVMTEKEYYKRMLNI